MDTVSLKSALLDPERWLQISDYLDRLLDLAPEQHEALLSELRISEPAIEEVLRDLLSAPDDASWLLQRVRMAAVDLATSKRYIKLRACTNSGWSLSTVPDSSLTALSKAL
jgi:hypothetical protein